MPLVINEAVNLFVGDTGPDNSKHLNLEEAAIPTLEEVGETYFPGGSVGEVEIGGLGLRALELTFKLKGFDPQVMSQFGLGSRTRIRYTLYGALRDKKSGSAVELKALIEGRLNRISGDALKRGGIVNHDYRVHEIFHYELYWNGSIKYIYDFLTSTWQVDGVSQNADINNILRIPTG